MSIDKIINKFLQPSPRLTDEMGDDFRIRFHMLPIGVTFKLDGHRAVKHSATIARVQYWPPEWEKMRMNPDYICRVEPAVAKLHKLDELGDRALMKVSSPEARAWLNR